MDDNLSLLQKADIALADLTVGGKLQPEAAQKFIRLLIDDSKLMKMSTVHGMKSHTGEIPKAKFGSRILRPGVEAQALAQGDRTKPDITNTELVTKLFKAEVRIPNEVLEDNIEQDSFKDTVMAMMGERMAADMDEIAVKGDTASADLFLAQFDGILKQATSNTYAHGGVVFNAAACKAMLKTMPSQYLRQKDKLRYITSTDAYIDYADSIIQRATPGGDQALFTSQAPLYSGIPVLDCPMFPENISGNQTNAILTDPKNIAYGIWREITIETDKDISAGVLKIVASIRFVVKFIEEGAVVKGTGILVG